MKPEPLTDDQLDAMDSHARIQYFKRLGFSHNAACYIGYATNPLRRKWELQIALNERAALRSSEPNDLTKDRERDRDDLVAEQRRRDA